MAEADFARTLITIVLAGGGLWAAGVGLRRLLLRNPELDWAPVAGKIRISGVEERRDGDGDKHYSHTLEYAYEFHGARFLGSRIAPMDYSLSFRFSAEERARRYPPGREVTVYVNPLNPGRAVLEPGRQTFVATCHVLIGVAALVFAFIN